MAKLAPSYYDPVIVDHELRVREVERRRMAGWDEALEKVYGPRTAEQREADRRADELRNQPPPIHPNTLRALERERANFEFWKAAGKLAKARYEEFQKRRPHHIPRFGQITQLIEIAFDFQWIATGRDWRNPNQVILPVPTPDDFEADLHRAYGHLSTANEPGILDAKPETPDARPKIQDLAFVAESVEQASPHTVSKEPETPDAKPETPDARPQAQDPKPETRVGRRDAWGSLARHQRQLSRR